MIVNVICAAILFSCVVGTLACFLTESDENAPYDWEKQGF